MRVCELSLPAHLLGVCNFENISNTSSEAELCQAGESVKTLLGIYVGYGKHQQNPLDVFKAECTVCHQASFSNLISY